MEKSNIYDEIASRTNGDVYIGVVGPVRTGKSTMIKKFMDNLVIPNITDENKKERAIDELPQSAAGKTIMTTEPKFVPNEAVEVNLSDNANLKMRMVDCVGYVIPTATGHLEGNEERMVQTPWSDDAMPFAKAAEIGTKKVITEHSTIGLVVTSDGTITDIPRGDYILAEEKVVDELKEINKPFVILLNSVNPMSDRTQDLRQQLEEKYCVPVMALSVADLNQEQINEIIERVLFEFPLSEVEFDMPAWFESLGEEHWLVKSVVDSVVDAMCDCNKIREVRNAVDRIGENENIGKISIADIDLSTGSIKVEIKLKGEMFYSILQELTGVDVCDDSSMLKLFIDYAKTKQEYDKIAMALDEVKAKGYGIVQPTIDELVLEEPEIIRQGNRYGVRLRASAPSIHMIRADIETEVNPIVGTEKQSEELVNYLLNEFNDEPTKIWSSNIFGKSLDELVNEGLHNKLERMPDEAQFKLQETLTRIINEGSGGLICIIL
ncbi:MAG: stage IV sporulation protein A [Clostridiales bacterium]|nr:stage IV sporulation protein A [Clostridiales bacterium]